MGVSQTESSIEAEWGEGEIALRISGFPESCPWCHRSIHANFRFAYLSRDALTIETVFQCPSSDCQHLFMAFYGQPSRTITSNLYDLFDVQPVAFQERQFSPQIVSISAPFVRIFQQAARAELSGLTEIAGPGYRKALEFLVKDYAISSEPSQAEIIRTKPLGKVIDDHVTDKNVKSTAKRAAWLGNDETHYYRIWADQDIEDMKTLIELTVRWIESEELTRDYERRMAANP